MGGGIMEDGGGGGLRVCLAPNRVLVFANAHLGRCA